MEANGSQPPKENRSFKDSSRSFGSIIMFLQSLPPYHINIGWSRSFDPVRHLLHLKRNRANEWKVDEYDEGYGKLAAIESCDPNFLIYRKFLWLHNRVLLKYQDELAELEEDLESLDRHDYQNDDKRLISRRRDDAFADSERKELIKMIAEKLASYG